MSTGACFPPDLSSMLDRLSRWELEQLACSFYGRDPVRFEQLVLELWARREGMVTIALPAPAPGVSLSVVVPAGQATIVREAARANGIPL